MKIIREKDWIDFVSLDEYGEFILRICHKGNNMQLQLHTCDDEDEAYCNINLGELIEIRDMINEVILLKQ